MSENTTIVAGLAVVASIFVIAWHTSPGPSDPCTPHMIQRYTKTIIAYKDCEALGEQCHITPTDTNRFNSAQTSFDACVAIVSGVE